MCTSLVRALMARWCNQAGGASSTGLYLLCGTGSVQSNYEVFKEASLRCTMCNTGTPVTVFVIATCEAGLACVCFLSDQDIEQPQTDNTYK